MASRTSTRRGILGAIAIAPVVIAAPVLATTHSRIEAYRLEYRAVFNALNASPSWDDDCPVVAAQCERMKALEGLIASTPCANTADAKAKLRFACEVAKDGIALDGDDASDMMTDIAKHLL